MPTGSTFVCDVKGHANTLYICLAHFSHVHCTRCKRTIPNGGPTDCPVRVPHKINRVTL